MSYRKTYNPCDDCNHSYSNQNQESSICKICEFKQLLEQSKELDNYKRKIRRLKDLKEKEPNNMYHNWDEEIAQQELNITECVCELN